MEYEEFLFSDRGRRHFILSEDNISVTGKGLNETFLLRDLEPEYRTVRQRSAAFYVGLIGAFLALILVLFTTAGFPVTDLVELPYVLAVIMAVISLLILFSSGRKVEHAVFKNTTGIDVLSIAKAGPHSSKFKLFVNEVARRVQNARSIEGQP